MPPAAFQLAARRIPKLARREASHDSLFRLDACFAQIQEQATRRQLPGMSNEPFALCLGDTLARINKVGLIEKDIRPKDLGELGFATSAKEAKAQVGQQLKPLTTCSGIIQHPAHSLIRQWLHFKLLPM